MTPYKYAPGRIDESWDVSHGLADRPDHVRIGYHAYWRLEFGVNATSRQEAEQRVLTYADKYLEDDLRHGFALAIMGSELSAECPKMRYSVDLYILDRDWIPEDLYNEQRDGFAFSLPVHLP